MKVSIITATYNSESTIRSTIESVLAQTYTDWQHIIVDGGSTDSTLSIIDEYRDAYNGRITLVSESDRGIYDAMNKGLDLANGDVVGILNSDDFFTTDKVVERLVGELAADPKLDAVYGDICYVDHDEPTRVVRYYSSEGFRRWKMALGFMPAHPSFYCRREVYRKYGNFDLGMRVAADFENLLRLIYLGGISTRYLPMNFVTMRVGGASTQGLRSHRAIFTDHRNAYRKNGVKLGLWLDWLRYPYRFCELISFRLHTHRN